jgi:hypothetical protein
MTHEQYQTAKMECEISRVFAQSDLVIFYGKPTQPRSELATAIADHVKMKTLNDLLRRLLISNK